MTAEPSSRTRLYASRQASLSILVAIAAEPQGGHSAQKDRARPGPASGIGAKLGRAGSWREAAAGDGGGGDSNAEWRAPNPQRLSGCECHRERAWTQAAPRRPPAAPPRSPTTIGGPDRGRHAPHIHWPLGLRGGASLLIGSQSQPGRVAQLLSGG